MHCITIVNEQRNPERLITGRYLLKKKKKLSFSIDLFSTVIVPSLLCKMIHILSHVKKKLFNGKISSSLRGKKKKSFLAIIVMDL